MKPSYHSESDRISQLIACVLARMATPEQIKELDRWLALSEDNRRLFDSIQSSDEQQRREKLRSMLNRERSWKRIESRIGAPKRRLGGVKIAAAVAVLAVGIASLWRFAPQDEAPQVAESPAAERCAVLVTEQGERIALGEELGAVTDNSDRVIASVRGQSLDYTESPAGEQSTNTLLIPDGGRYHVTLSDGTSVWLNAGSRMSYPTGFSGGERRVKLTGEAFFDVVPDQTCPFIVETGDGAVRVLGTRFNVKAYDDQPGSVTTLLMGSVEVFSGGRACVLVPGDQAEIGPGGQISLRKVDAELYASWVEGILYFNRTPLDQVLQTLGRAYEVKARFADDDLREITYTGRLDCNNPIESILELLSLTGSVTMTLDEKMTVNITRKKE